MGCRTGRTVWVRPPVISCRILLGGHGITPDIALPRTCKTLRPLRPSCRSNLRLQRVTAARGRGSRVHASARLYGYRADEVEHSSGPRVTGPVLIARSMSGARDPGFTILSHRFYGTGSNEDEDGLSLVFTGSGPTPCRIPTRPELLSLVLRPGDSDRSHQLRRRQNASD